MKDVSVNDGRTVLFVSHNISAIRALCNRGLFLENGRVKDIGKIDNVINLYQNGARSNTKWAGIDGDDTLSVISTSVKPHGRVIEDDIFFSDDNLNVSVGIEIHKYMNDPVIGFSIFSNFGYPIVRVLFNDYNNLQGMDVGCYKIEFTIPKYSLASGGYNLNFDIAIPHVKKVNSEAINLSFDIISKGEYGNKFLVENSAEYNSLVRPNWFDKVTKI